MTDLLILGLGVAGFAAAKKAREMDFKIEITAMDPWEYDAFSPCGLPFLLDGTVERMDALYHRLPLKDMNINKIVGKVVSLNTDTKVVTYLDTDGDTTKEIPYKKLIIAVGGHTFVPGIDGVEELIEKGVFKFNDPLDAKKVLAVLESGAKKAVVIGSGPLGCELALRLANRGLDVTLCEGFENILTSLFDPDMAQEVQTFLELKGIDVRTGSRVSRVTGT